MGKTTRRSHYYLGYPRARAIHHACQDHATRALWSVFYPPTPESIAQAGAKEARIYDRAHRDGAPEVCWMRRHTLAPFKPTRRAMRARLAQLTPEGWDDGFDPRLSPRFRDDWW